MCMYIYIYHRCYMYIQHIYKEVHVCFNTLLKEWNMITCWSTHGPAKFWSIESPFLPPAAARRSSSASWNRPRAAARPGKSCQRPKWRSHERWGDGAWCSGWGWLGWLGWLWSNGSGDVQATTVGRVKGGPATMRSSSSSIIIIIIIPIPIPIPIPTPIIYTWCTNYIHTIYTLDIHYSTTFVGEIPM